MENVCVCVCLCVRTDVTRLSEGCEVKLEGGGPWNPFPDVEVLHTPGHTAGSISILFTPKASPDTETDPYGAAHLHIHIHTYIHSYNIYCIHTYIHTYMPTYIHKHIYIYFIYIHSNMGLPPHNINTL